MEKQDDKIDTHYTDATIYFPEWEAEMRNAAPDESFFNNLVEPKLNGNLINYKEHGFIVEAHIYPHNIPVQLADMPEVKKKILDPVVKVIKSDVSSIEDLLGDLRKLARTNKIHNKMYYTRNMNGDEFNVYDYALEKKFDKLHQITKIPRIMLHRDYLAFYNLAERVTPRQENPMIACIKGSTLKEATERALKIYNSKEEIDKIDELFRENR